MRAVEPGRRRQHHPTGRLVPARDRQPGRAVGCGGFRERRPALRLLLGRREHSPAFVRQYEPPALFDEPRPGQTRRASANERADSLRHGRFV
jgi:hypothetical protein